MSHTIKIHMPSHGHEVDKDEEIDLTREQAERLTHFLSLAHYGTVYPQMPSHGDGNRKGSKSDLETRETLAALHILAGAFEKVVKP